MADKVFRGKRVSGTWYVILTEAAKSVVFQLNSGRRTRSEQERLIREKGIWSPSNPTGAAAYSPSAPHIRVGREDHALDVDTGGGGNARLTRWLEGQGVTMDHEIGAEPWHMEARSERALRALATRLRARNMDPVLKKGRVNRSATIRLQKLLRGNGYKSVRVNGKYDLLTRAVVRKFQRANKIGVTPDTRVGPATWKALRG